MSETVVVRLRPHARSLFFPVLLLVAVAGAFGFLSGLREQWQVIAVCAAAVALLIAGFLIPLLRWLATGYTITTRRIAVRNGLLVRSRHELLLSRAHSVSVTRSVGQSLFGSGNVVVNPGSDGEIILTDVPSPALVRETLHDLIEGNRTDSSIG